MRRQSEGEEFHLPDWVARAAEWSSWQRWLRSPPQWVAPRAEAWRELTDAQIPLAPARRPAAAGIFGGSVVRLDAIDLHGVKLLRYDAAADRYDAHPNCRRSGNDVSESQSSQNET